MSTHRMATTMQQEVPTELLEALQATIKWERFNRTWPIVCVYFYIGATAGLLSLALEIGRWAAP